MSDTGDAQAVESTAETAETAEPTDERADDHLADVDDGCGCAEVWEHLSEQRED